MIYLDYNATTPLDAQVLQAMLPCMERTFGNASSIHSAGQHARAAVDRARESVAALIGASPAEIVFTSGGTEANNLALLGLVSAASSSTRRHVIATAIEHHAVLNACQELERRGFDVTYLQARSNGVVDAQDVRRAITSETVLISAMHANNEIGTIQPIEEIGRIAAEADIYFHCDAVQSAGKLRLDVNQLGVDLLSISAHKFYGPKGVGALYVRPGTPLEPLFFGGHHERDRRPGTENVPGIVGIGKAAELARACLDEDTSWIAALRDRFETALVDSIPDARINGNRETRVCNTTNVTFTGAGGEALLIALDLEGIACSTGAACSSGSVEPSHVLTAIGLSDDEARSTLRFSLGRGTAAHEIDRAIEVIPRVVERIRSLSPRSDLSAKDARARTVPVR
ncbi:MAG TPA: cysteine desulfurase family protein [Candidatus Acidoferrales bacterium]|nr:cysteine desulfurase family protein [Candidatus Acidoferrales bacterium]